MRERWATTLVSLGAVLAVTAVFDLTGSLISDFAIAMVVTVATLMVPNKLWERVRGNGGSDGQEGPPAEVKAMAEAGQ
jgi:uncharacterized membrane protein